MPTKITHCVCSKISFEELKNIRLKNKSKKINNIKQLREFAEFGINCKLCLPYVKLMLQTGQTVFTEVI